MNPMETMALSMLSKMTGLEPDQMQAMAKGGLEMLQSVDVRLTNIEKMLAALQPEGKSDE